MAEREQQLQEDIVNTCEGMCSPLSPIVLERLSVVEKLLSGGLVVSCGRPDST